MISKIKCITFVKNNENKDPGTSILQTTKFFSHKLYAMYLKVHNKLLRRLTSEL